MKVLFLVYFYHLEIVLKFSAIEKLMDADFYEDTEQSLELLLDQVPFGIGNNFLEI